MEKLRLNLDACLVIVTENSESKTVTVSVHPHASGGFRVEEQCENALTVGKRTPKARG